MNKKDFKNPLIQSGAILLLVFLLISIVAGSGSQGILGSVGALISGIFSTVIFLIGLCIAIVFSIAVLVGVYLAAVYFYSADKGRNLVEQLKAALCSLYSKVKGIQVKAKFSAPQTAESEPEPKAAVAAGQSVEPAPVSKSQVKEAAAEPIAYNCGTILEWSQERQIVFQTRPDSRIGTKFITRAERQMVVTILESKDRESMQSRRRLSKNSAATRRGERGRWLLRAKREQTKQKGGPAGCRRGSTEKKRLERSCFGDAF